MERLRIARNRLGYDNGKVKCIGRITKGRKSIEILAVRLKSGIAVCKLLNSARATNKNQSQMIREFRELKEKYERVNMDQHDKILSRMHRLNLTQ